MSKLKNGVVIMTALPPTTGHIDLITFASRFLSSMSGGLERGGKLVVIVNGRSFEPNAHPWNRAVQVELCLGNSGYGSIEVLYDENDSAPQNPVDHPDFWNWWNDSIRSIIRSKSRSIDELSDGDYLFASEMYGVELARAMSLEFIPYDIAREMNPIKATNVRVDPLDHFDSIPRAFQPQHVERVVLFGAESCGKTTMAQRLQTEWVGSRGQRIVTSYPEWARPYLEVTGRDINEGKMEAIMRGQYALQSLHDCRKSTTPIQVFDTDLLSTLGYYQISGIPPHKDMEPLIACWTHGLYIVMNSGIPFEEDPIRYGGDVRQSTDQFWIDILVSRGCDYHIVTNTDPHLQYEEIKTVISEYYMRNRKELAAFVRT